MSRKRLISWHDSIRTAMLKQSTSIYSSVFNIFFICLRFILIGYGLELLTHSVSNEATSSTMLMNKHKSSIKSSFVGLTKGDRTDDSDRASSSDDSIKSGFIGLTNDVVTNGCDKSSNFVMSLIFSIF